MLKLEITFDKGGCKRSNENNFDYIIYCKHDKLLQSNWWRGL